MTEATAATPAKEGLPIDQVRGWLFHHAEDVREARKGGKASCTITLHGDLDMEAFERVWSIIDFNWAHEKIIREAYIAHRRKKKR